MARCDRPPGRSKKATDGHEAAKRHTKDDVDGTKACATVAQYARHLPGDAHKARCKHGRMAYVPSRTDPSDW